MKKKILIGLGVLIALVLVAFATKQTKIIYTVNTTIELKEPILNLGKINLDSLVRVNIPLKNTSKQPLLISKIEKSNASLVVDETAQYFPIDKPVELTLLYQPNKLDLINESLILHGNFPEQQITIPVVGQVVK